MIGGQVIIPIRGVNNEKITIESDPVELKAGTYKKIKRAIELQKEIVFEDLYIDTFANKFTSGSIITSPKEYGTERVVIKCDTLAEDSGTYYALFVYITVDNVAYFALT